MPAGCQRSGSDCAILVFARAPIPGRAKRRLIPAIGANAAAALQERMTAHTVQTAVAAGIGPVTLFTTPDTTHPSFSALVVQHKIGLAVQQGNDLGERMYVALTDALKPPSPHPYALLIGSDCPELGADTLGCARDRLHQGAQMVFVPAVDGGYALIGARTRCPPVFAGVPWGESQVMAQTRRLMKALGVSWQELPEHHDIDRPVDLDRIRSTALWEDRNKPKPDE